MNSPELSSKRRSYSAKLTRDQRLQVLTLFRAGISRVQISERLGIGYGQVKYTIKTGRASPSKSTGRPTTLSIEQEDELEEFVRSSPETRRMSYFDLAMRFPDWNVGEKSIGNTLRRRGYSRYVARSKPPLSDANKRLRLEWAHRHLHFSLDDWCRIIWSDETYISDDRINKVYVTRKINEEYDALCIIHRRRKTNAWMFWGSFAGTRAGPCVFWERSWGTMTGAGYCERILPSVVELIRSDPRSGNPLEFMHDNAAVHTAGVVKRYLEAHEVEVMAWPPYSPDLNPIENVWGLMKTHIQDRYTDSDQGRQRSRAEVLPLVQDAWQQCTRPEILLRILEGMRGRCEAVIQAGGESIDH